MSREEAVRAILVGIERAKQASADGIDVIGAGEMGIGSTTTSAAVLAALTGLSAEDVTGRGGGLTDAAFEKKKDVIQEVSETSWACAFCFRPHRSAFQGRRPGSGSHVRPFPGGCHLPHSGCH